MSHVFRLLDTGFRDAFYNMGLDQALLEAVSRGASLPCLRFYAWKPLAVSVGYFQGLDEEVNLSSCRERGVDVVRRLTGGGAVFHNAELTYSLVLPLKHPLAGRNIQKSYEILCSGIVRGLKNLGLEASFVPVNDIECMGKKISGNAQTRKTGALLQHGTILLDTDPDLMFELLKVPPQKTGGRRITGAKQRVSSLKALLGREVPYEEALDAMRRGFLDALELEFTGTPGNPPEKAALPSGEEDERALDLAKNRFADPNWIGVRP
ncbi:MAG: lipoate--protein ligase family protein [Spirochaetaceae bacterium]|jgi:lipoate-protein ligase A|nr:lipoate--protein ligase family protein [Spirochaetaceae bacterium]